ncbi:MAG: MFS transporter [Actinobacteria bacterium]|nr:MAG: MFS transporter [Actinomycetota bacterium]
MTAPAAVRRTFSSLGVFNYRLYFFGQIVSVSGTWMQAVAQSWLVLQLTGSGTAIGLVVALQFLPMLFLAPLGGVIADRFDKRRLLILTQSAAALLAALLGLLIVTGAVELWMIYVLAACLGIINSIDTPTRQTFVLEMVGREGVTNAVSLNAVLVNLARVLGPAIAGALIVTVGIGVCFLINAASYLAVILALAVMRADELHPSPAQPRRSGQLREGLRYVRATPAVLTPLLMMAVVGTFAYEYQVVLPLLARFTFEGDAKTYAAMTALMGAGAVVGGLLTAARRSRSALALGWAAAVFGAVQLAVALAPTLPVALATLTVLGAASISFLALGNATLQLNSAPDMRGRVMGLWAVAFLGSTPIGGPIVGWIGEQFGPRFALGLGGAVTVLAGAFAFRSLGAVDREAAVAVDGGDAVEAPPVKLGP